MRRQYTLITDEKKIESFLRRFATPDNINTKNLTEAFSRRPKKDSTGKIVGTSEPEFYHTDEFILRKDVLKNTSKDIQTTFGLYIFNLFCVSSVFGTKVSYVEDVLNGDNLSALQTQLTNRILKNEISVEEYGRFQDRFVFLSYRGSLFNPGMTYDMVTTNDKVIAMKKRLMEENKDKLDPSNSAYAANYQKYVEKPLLEFNKTLLSENAQMIYDRGEKPKYGNVGKNMTISMGPVVDPQTGKYKIIKEALSEGVRNENIPDMSNVMISAIYNRAINTADGGYSVKLLYAAMQSITADKPGSDCGSERYLTKTLYNEADVKINLGRYFLPSGGKKLVKLTLENYKDFIGKPLRFRSPLFCGSKNGQYCSTCLGDFFHELGIASPANTATAISSNFMQLSLKAMHDVSVSTIDVDIEKYVAAER